MAFTSAGLAFLTALVFFERIEIVSSPETRQNDASEAHIPDKAKMKAGRSRSNWVTIGLSVIGYLLITIWALPCLMALLVFAEMLFRGIGGAGFSGSGAAIGIGLLLSLCAALSCTVLPIGMVFLYAARLLRGRRS